MNKKSQPNGFAAVWIIAAIVIAAIGFTAWFASYNHQSKNRLNNVAKSPPSTKPTPKPATSDPYAGWQTATSTRTGFSIKYPATWNYKEILGSKDNVEHITIDDSQFRVLIDSYSGKDTSSGGQPATTCTDCLQTVSTHNLTVPGLGRVNLNTVTYKLDSGQGNALILELPDSTYYIPSPDNTNTYTSFRGISVLASENAYQAETMNQFTANPDFAIAQKILESVSY